MRIDSEGKVRPRDGQRPHDREERPTDRPTDRVPSAIEFVSFPPSPSPPCSIVVKHCSEILHRSSVTSTFHRFHLGGGGAAAACRRGGERERIPASPQCEQATSPSLHVPSSSGGIGKLAILCQKLIAKGGKETKRVQSRTSRSRPPRLEGIMILAASSSEAAAAQRRGRSNEISVARSLAPSSSLLAGGTGKDGKS